MNVFKRRGHLSFASSNLCGGLAERHFVENCNALVYMGVYIYILGGGGGWVVFTIFIDALVCVC